MKDNEIPSYEIISYPIKLPVGIGRFGAKPIVASSHHKRPNEPWNKEYLGITEQKAIAKAQAAIDYWINQPQLRKLNGSK